VRGPFRDWLYLQSVGRRARANKEPEDGENPNDDDRAVASDFERGEADGRHWVENLHFEACLVKFLRHANAAPRSGEMAFALLAEADANSRKTRDPLGLRCNGLDLLTILGVVTARRGKGYIWSLRTASRPRACHREC
jgi:hypothetical protein